MPDTAIALVGLGLAFWTGVGLAYLFAHQHETYLKAELKEATNRLYLAWQAGATIPPRSDAYPPVEVEPLPAGLQPYVDRWESQGSRMAEEARIRKWLGEGWSAERIERYFADPADA